MQPVWQDFIASQPLDSQPQPLRDNALYPLLSQGFIEVSGIDAAKFLQGQLSCDIQQLSVTHSGLGSHSNAKGRMQSSFRICRVSDTGFLLRLHASILESARAMLAKYVVFSKATITIRQDMVGIGLHGRAAAQALSSMASHVPGDMYGQHIENGRITVCTDDALPAYEIYCQADAATELWASLASHLHPCHESQHTLVENRLGLAFVEAGTADAFVPQMFNYQCTPAISFRKGCYTGQEIVARMHYLGKVKRHMRHYSVTSTTPLSAGMPVYGQGEQPVGDILVATATSNDNWDVLINLTDEAASTGQLRTSLSSLQPLQEIPLPYTLSD